MSITFHEQLHRGPELMGRLRVLPITVCGAGAVGANLVETLARSGAGQLRVIDRDRIEERNLSTQPYQRGDVGAFKAKILAHTLYRAVGTEVEALSTELTPANIKKLLAGSALVVDAFDNSHSRRAVTDYCTAAAIPCLHVGLAAGYAEVIWNERYRVPSDAHDDICDYPLARTLVLLAVAVATETIVQFVACGSREDRTITLADLTVGQFL